VRGERGRAFMLWCAEGLGRKEPLFGVLGDVGGDVCARLSMRL
jgi:hypothetical protein